MPTHLKMALQRWSAGSVRHRLIALCVGLFLGFCGSSILLVYLIGRMRSDHLAQDEQERRLSAIADVESALGQYRHVGGQVNSARLTHQADKEREARADYDKATRELFADLGRLGDFDAQSQHIITAALSEVSALSEQAITAFAAGKEDASALAELQRRLDLVESTLRDASRRENDRTVQIQQAGERRSYVGLRIAILISALTAIAEILLILTVLRSIIRPLRITTAAIRQVNSGELALDLPPIGTDEFGEMAQALRHFRDRADKLRRLAYQDALTGLDNRAQLGETLERALEEAEGTGQSVVLLYLDLDRFRTLNERVGNWRADRFLCEVANRLSRFMPPTATLFRHGGDKFVVLLDDVSQDESMRLGLQGVGESVMRGVAEPYAIGGEILTSTMSVGIGIAPEDGTTAEQLIRSAEAAVHTAKRDGGNKIRFAGGQQTAAMRTRARLAAEITRGMRQGQFELFYQPIVDYAQRRVIAAEGLLRWRHPERGLLNAGDFIDVAEEEGLIARLGEQCLRIAHEQARAWHRQGLRVRLAVNVSARQLQESDILRILRELHSDQDPPEGLLDLELTESALFDHSDHTRTMLEEIRLLGYRLGLDDFGTGYSSLSYLERLPIDKIKIDRQFVAGMESRTQTLAIVNATLTLARSLQLEVVAEGVETESQARLLLDLGCGLLQGFHFSRALPAGEFEEWVVRFESTPVAVNG